MIREPDELSFTQPIMYKLIKKHESALSKYQKTLDTDKVVTKAESKKMVTDFNDVMQQAYESLKKKVETHEN